ncbi:uncharacterized protein LOC131317674 [Rhododendron vialii]|uniref:uncharacterized protein LOC131317674 n=1 Tax=Rhododendron vialii TaxID=182163 RepID=UPI00265F8223|nr:uncharacterized protein LOC131317674 [Rhododendron vialii]XP_058203211.1 uncharacterized protein LOC131317674 [Rhododendron vialii]
MVGAQCATFRHPPSTNLFPPPRKPIIILCSISNPFPSKPTKRKNHLRQKLLETLTNPVIPKTPPTNSVIPFESPQEAQTPVAKESEETQELQSLTSEAAAGVVRGKFGNFPIRSVLLFLVGAFVFQAICAVWVSGLVNSARKDENLDSGSEETRVSELGVDGNGEERSVFFLTGSNDPLGGRLWFRQVRNGFVGGSEFEKKINEIQAMAREAREKERLDSAGNVDGVKTGIELEVERELDNFRKSLPKSSEKAQENVKKPGSIMFKQKYPFNEVAKPESGNGSTQGNGIQRPLVKGVISSNSSIGSKRAGGKVEDRRSDDKADLWWLSLPYVLVICYLDGEGAKGLFTLESKGDSSHTIAFEDQGDASNFCYLLQSFFEELGDFSAEIVPLPTKELNEAVSSDNMKVIVVKKGQLKLYAGQPLEEVEMALRSLAQ